MNLITADRIADRRLQEASFHELSLPEDITPPSLAKGPEGVLIPYVVLGDRDAPHLVFATSPYGCQVTDPSQLVRLQAQQIALGDEACVVGLHVYDPQGLRLPPSDRKQVAKGSFRPYADRVLSVIEDMQPRDDQLISLYGFSMGADVSIETTYQVVTDPLRGIVPIDRLGAFEPARSVKRGAIAVAQAFKDSGPDLFDNVIASNSPALLSARGIDLDDPKARQRHEKEIGKEVVRAFLRDIAGGVANMRGFANDNSLRQLNELIELDVLPQTSIGRVNRSTICPAEFIALLKPSGKIDSFTMNGDHSLADNVRASAAMVVQAVLL